MLKIKESDYGMSVVGYNYISGDIVHVLTGQMQLFPNRESIQIGDYHVVDRIGQYINHSFNPNCIIVNNTVVAIRDIIDEEITFDYTKNEKEISNPFIDKDTGKEVGFI